MKKIALVALAGVLACGSIACGGGGGGVDKTKTQLYVTTFEGGYGTVWLENVKKRFEEKYAGTSFESGKTGVEIIIKEDRNLTNDLLIQNLEGSSQEVFFTEAVNYYDLQDRGLLYDISDALTKPLNYNFLDGTTAADEETVSILDKMLDSHKDFYKADDGKYYGMPFYEANYGIVYDVDLFEDYNLYFAAEGKGDKKGFVKSLTTPRSNGPDGKANTADDGLPATYDDFFKLCDQMVNLQITPITWNGKNPQYVNALVESLQADYEGEEQMRINYTSDGVAKNLVKEIKDDGSIETYEELITTDNGYLTWTKQAGKYYGLKFVDRLTANESYYSKREVVSSSYEHLDAQIAFVMDKFLPDKQPVGMLIEGSWWHNEAADAFKACVQQAGPQAAAISRRFSFMPLPKATADKVGEEYTILGVNRSICFVNGNLDKKKDALAKEFIQFCHTNDSLAEFTTTTYTCKPYAYTMTDAQLETIPYWGRELYRLHNEAKFMSTFSKSEVYKMNEGSYTEYWNAKMFQSAIGNLTYGTVTEAMILDKDNGLTITAKDYFEGLSAYLTKERWDREFLMDIAE